MAQWCKVGLAVVAAAVAAVAVAVAVAVAQDYLGGEGAAQTAPGSQQGRREQK